MCQTAEMVVYQDESFIPGFYEIVAISPLTGHSAVRVVPKTGPGSADLVLAGHIYHQAVELTRADHFRTLGSTSCEGILVAENGKYKSYDNERVKVFIQGPGSNLRGHYGGQHNQCPE